MALFGDGADAVFRAHRVADFPEQTDREQLRELLTAATEEVRRSIREEILRLDHRIGQLEAEMKGVEKAIEEWRAKRDPEPPRHSDTEQARRELRERGIPFVPLYAAVEFRDAVSAAERERIESALMQMGILDALIVPSAMLESGGEAVRHDRVLKPAPHLLAPTLADYLYPVEGEGMPVLAEDVDRVLRSIRIGEAAGDEGRAGGLGRGSGAGAGRPAASQGAFVAHRPIYRLALGPSHRRKRHP